MLTHHILFPGETPKSLLQMLEGGKIDLWATGDLAGRHQMLKTAKDPPVSSLDGLEFRRASIADAEALTRLMGQTEVLRNTLQLPLPNAEIWRKRLETQVVDPLQIHVVALHGADLIGSAGLHPVTGSLRTRHVAGLGLCVAPAWWGRGVGTELMRRLLEWADNWAGLLRIELGVFSDNARAIALYRKFGFELEGTQRAWALRDGVYTDSLMLAQLRRRIRPNGNGDPT